MGCIDGRLRMLCAEIRHCAEQCAVGRIGDIEACWAVDPRAVQIRLMTQQGGVFQLGNGLGGLRHDGSPADNRNRSSITQRLRKVWRTAMRRA